MDSLIRSSNLEVSLKELEGRGGKLLERKTGDSKPCSMPLGSLLLSSIGKSRAILTICMAFHQAVKTTGKSTESRPPYLGALVPLTEGSLLTSSPRKTYNPLPFFYSSKYSPLLDL